MKTLILSYSFSGNNKKFAESLANKLKAKHIEIKEQKERSIKSIMLDVIFHRKQKVLIDPEIVNDYENVIFVGPFWMGKIATPLKPYFKHNKTAKKPYGFITVSGGSLGKNNKYTKELINRNGFEPMFCCDYYIVDLMDKSEDKSMKESSSYSLSENDVTNLVDKTISHIKKDNVLSAEYF